MNTVSHHPNDDATTPELIGGGGTKPAALATPKEVVPGAQGQPHTTITGAGHFL